MIFKKVYSHLLNNFVACEGCVLRNVGLELLTPKLEHLRACPSCNPTMIPTPKKNNAPAQPQPSPSTCHTEREEQWRTYWVDNK